MFRKIFALIILLFISPANANDLTIILPAAEDSHAINARILGRHLQKYTNQTAVYRVVPGAASAAAAHHLYNIAPKDGNTIGVFFKNIPLVSAIGTQNFNFDASKFTWLGSTADGRKDAVLLLSNKLYENGLVVGSDNVIAADPIRFIKMSTNLDLKQIMGYKNQSEIRLALERGEIDAMVNSLIGIKTSRPQWLLPNSKIKAILQFGNGKERHPEFPNVPTLSEIIPAEYQKLLELFETQFILLRPYVAPPDIPQERARFLREAFKNAVLDPQYIEEANRANIEVNLVSWQEAERIVNIISSSNRMELDQLR